MPVEHPPLSSEFLDEVETVLTRSIDAHAGYKVMVEKSEKSFLYTATRFRDIHADHIARLRGALGAAGRNVDDEGSFMSTVNRGVINLRALFDEIDDDVMDQVRNGEDHILDAFDDAIEDAPHGHDLTNRLIAMKTEIKALLAETAHLD
jgi:uncharacterized protein (TIGR02284 family)